MASTWWRGVGFLGIVALCTFTGCVGCPTRGPVQWTVDTSTTHQIKAAIKARYPELERTVTVKTFDQVVSLGGTVNSPTEKERVIAIAQQVSRVNVVLDYMKVRNIPAGQKT